MSSVQTDERGLLVACSACGQRNRLAFERLAAEFRCGKCQQTLQAPAEAIDVSGEQSFANAISRASVPVLVDFWAPWCGPCKMVAPEVARLAAETSGRLLVLKLNTDAVPSVAQQFQISGIPTFILFDGGREAARQSGAMSAAQLRRFVESAVAARA